MCRVFAFISVSPILLDDVLVRPINAITNQIIGSFQGEQFVNADGFGITWHTDARSEFNPLKDEPSPGEQVVVGGGLLRHYDGLSLPFVRGPHPAMYKTIVAKPLNDPSFLSLCANVSSKCIFAHLRGAGGPPTATTNNHPFVFGRHCFMHNGMISDFRVIRKEMLSHVTEGFTAMIEGGTDSEHLAAIYMSHLCKPGDFRGADKHYPATSMWKALKSAIQTVEDIQRKRGKTPDNFLNICATDGECLLALCYRTNNSPSTPPFDLWVSVDVADTLNRKPYAYSHAVIYKDTRAEDDVHKVAGDLQRNAKHVIRRDHDNNVIGIEPEIRRMLKEEERPFPSRHGPHVVVASEPTTITPGWFKLCNKDAILVDTVYQGDVQVLNLSPETL